MHPSDFKARIDFRHPLIPREGLSFPKFERLLVAQDLNEILPLVHEIEKATKDGAYAVGFLAYEAAPAFDDALSVREGDGPLAVFGLAGQAHGNGKMERDAFSFGRWKAAWARKDHGNAIETILEAIRAGETYQANLTFPLSTGFEGSIEACYQHLLKSQDADYCGMFSGPDFSVLSASPELFFERSGERLRTRPMKGTRRRGLTLEDDLARSSELTTSGKDRAENLMIVDLLRNDLGRIALPGSVSVDGLFDIEQTIHRDAAGQGDAAQVIAKQINDHEVFGAVLAAGGQFAGAGQVILQCQSTPPCALHGPGAQSLTASFEEQFRGCGEHGKVRPAEHAAVVGIL